MFTLTSAHGLVVIVLAMHGSGCHVVSPFASTPVDARLESDAARPDVGSTDGRDTPPDGTIADGAADVDTAADATVKDTEPPDDGGTVDADACVDPVKVRLAGLCADQAALCEESQDPDCDGLPGAADPSSQCNTVVYVEDFSESTTTTWTPPDSFDRICGGMLPVSYRFVLLDSTAVAGPWPDLLVQLEFEFLGLPPAGTSRSAYALEIWSKEPDGSSAMRLCRVFRPVDSDEPRLEVGDSNSSVAVDAGLIGGSLLLQAWAIGTTLRCGLFDATTGARIREIKIGSSPLPASPPAIYAANAKVLVDAVRIYRTAPSN